MFSQRPGELTDLTRRAIQDGATLLVVVGGDGTVHEVVNGAIGAGDVELAVLPRGTGKDFVRSLRIPSDVRAALAVARDGRPRTLDAGRATYRSWNGSEASAYFANFAGAGISGAIARRANRSSKALGGRVSFFAATLAVFASWKSADVTVQIDGERRSGDMFEVLVMNGDYAAGGMWVTPEAEPDDGRLDVLLIGDVSKADFIRTFPKIYRGKHLSHPKIDVLHGAAVRVPQALRVRVP